MIKAGSGEREAGSITESASVCPERSIIARALLSLPNRRGKSMRPKTFLMPVAFLLLASLAVRLGAQPAPPANQQTPPAIPAGEAGRGAPQGAGAPPQGRGRGQPTFPAQQRPPGDPEVIKRGNGLYGVYCRACHGTDLRGGDQGGPNLLRSQLVLNDQDGELILPVVQQGRPKPGDAGDAAAEYPARRRQGHCHLHS